MKVIFQQRRSIRPVRRIVIGYRCLWQAALRQRHVLALETNPRASQRRPRRV